MLNIVRQSTKIVVFSLFMMPTLSFAWGNLGHSISASITERLLTDKAKDFIKSVYPDISIMDIATYPDKFRMQYKAIWPASARWHFLNIPVCGGNSTALEIEQACVNYPDIRGQAACGLKQYWYFLQNVTKMTGKEQEMALAYLLHLLADYHQPLHVTDNGDSGANKQKIFMPTSRGKDTLHHAWDTNLVKGAVKGKAIDQFVDGVYNSYKSKFSEYRKGTLGDWVLESVEVGRDYSYGQLPGFDCRSSHETFVSFQPRLTEEYVLNSYPIIIERLVKAGVRMAMLLNQAIDGTLPAYNFPEPDRSSMFKNKAFKMKSSAMKYIS